MVLHGVRDYLRQQYAWTAKECGVQRDAIPPGTAGNYYIAIDDTGVDGTAADNDHLRESFNLEIGVWRRSGGKPDDRLGHLKLPDDIYLANVLSLTDLERRVLVSKNNTGGLHQNWSLWTYINSLFGLPSDTDGPGFTGALSFRGFSRLEGVALADTAGVPAFYGRRLRFSGLERTQIIRGSRATTG